MIILISVFQLFSLSAFCQLRGKMPGWVLGTAAPAILAVCDRVAHAPSRVGVGALAASFLADTIPSSPEEMKIIGYVATGIIIASVLTTAIWQLWGKPEKKRGIDGRQTVMLKAEVQFVAIEKFQEFEEYVHDQNHKMLNDMNGLKLTMEDRREETGAQFDAIRDKLDVKFSEAVDDGKENTVGTHKRIDMLAQQVGQLMGEVKHIGEAAKEAAFAAHQAAIAAASAGAAIAQRRRP